MMCTRILQSWLCDGLSASAAGAGLGCGSFFGGARGREQVTICFTCELAHAPIEHGKLTFDLVREGWIESHGDPRVMRLADAYLRAYRARHSVVGD